MSCVSINFYKLFIQIFHFNFRVCCKVISTANQRVNYRIVNVVVDVEAKQRGTTENDSKKVLFELITYARDY